MKKHKNTYFYIGLTAFCFALMYWVIFRGAMLENGKEIIAVQGGGSQWQEFITSLTQNFEHPVALILVQIFSIIVVARIFGWFCRKIGQPTVIGEMIAGIVLGPSLVGLYFPDFFNTLFPVESLGNLEYLSMIGLILYMFMVGIELDFEVLKNNAQEALVISHASIIIPFTLGIGLAYFVYEGFAPTGIPFLPFALFIGISMSITAFPVLARIVQERNIHKTKLGTIVMACAAVDDVTAWCLLAAVIAIAKAGSIGSALFTIGFAVLYVLLMLKIVKPFLDRIGSLFHKKGSLSKSVIGIVFLTLIISSYTTEVIGIHALFGAFMTGAIMPSGVKFRNLFIEKVEDVATIILLPLFFVYTGLRTEIGLLNDPELWEITGIVILVAIAGKFLGSFIAAKYVGQSWKDSLTIGTLMNTRGLVELVVLNIGYDLGVLSPEIFAILVIMSLVTTFMTGPLLDIINWIFKSKSKESAVELTRNDQFKVLINFDHPDDARSLLKLLSCFTKEPIGSTVITAVHVTPAAELQTYNIEEYEIESFAPIIEESNQLDLEVTTLFKVSNDMDWEITEIANRGNYDLLLIGIRHSIFEGSLLGKILGFTTRIINPQSFLDQVTGKENLFESAYFDRTTRYILNRSKVPVGILIDKGFTCATQVFIPIFSASDDFLVEYARKLIANSGSQVTFLDISGQLKNNHKLKELVRSMEQRAPNHIHIQSERVLDRTFLAAQDLMLVSIESWKKLMDSKSLWLAEIPSTLIIKESE